MPYIMAQAKFKMLSPCRRLEKHGCSVLCHLVKPGLRQSFARSCQDLFGLGVGEAAVLAGEGELIQEGGEAAEQDIRADVVVVLAEDHAFGVVEGSEVGFSGDEIADPGDEGDAFGGGVEGAVGDVADEDFKGVFGEGLDGHSDFWRRL